jgi:hypothetical protein
MLNTTYNQIRTKLQKLSESQLAELARNLGLTPEVHDIPYIVKDLAAEYIADMPELARFIPE